MVGCSATHHVLAESRVERVDDVDVALARLAVNVHVERRPDDRVGREVPHRVERGVGGRPRAEGRARLRAGPVRVGGGDGRSTGPLERVAAVAAGGVLHNPRLREAVARRKRDWRAVDLRVAELDELVVVHPEVEGGIARQRPRRRPAVACARGREDGGSSRHELLCDRDRDARAGRGVGEGQVDAAHELRLGEYYEGEGAHENSLRRSSPPAY